MFDQERDPRGFVSGGRRGWPGEAIGRLPSEGGEDQPGESVVRGGPGSCSEEPWEGRREPQPRDSAAEACYPHADPRSSNLFKERLINGSEAVELR